MPRALIVGVGDILSPVDCDLTTTILPYFVPPIPMLHALSDVVIAYPWDSPLLNSLCIKFALELTSIAVFFSRGIFAYIYARIIERGQRIVSVVDMDNGTSSSLLDAVSALETARVAANATASSRALKLYDVVEDSHIGE